MFDQQNLVFMLDGLYFICHYYLEHLSICNLSQTKIANRTSYIIHKQKDLFSYAVSGISCNLSKRHLYATKAYLYVTNHHIFNLSQLNVKNHHIADHLSIFNKNPSGTQHFQINIANIQANLFQSYIAWHLLAFHIILANSSNSQ